MRILFYPLFLASFSILSCKTARSVPAPPAPPVVAEANEQPPADEILFIMLGSNGEANKQSTAFTIIKTVKTAGKLKRRSGYIPNSDFIAYYTTATGQIIDSATFNDPLKQKTEYSDENGKIAVLDGQKATDVPVRVNYNQAMKKLRIVRRNNKTIINEFNL